MTTTIRRRRQRHHWKLDNLTTFAIDNQPMMMICNPKPRHFNSIPTTGFNQVYITFIYYMTDDLIFAIRQWLRKTKTIRLVVYYYSVHIDTRAMRPDNTYPIQDSFKERVLNGEANRIIRKLKFYFPITMRTARAVTYNLNHGKRWYENDDEQWKKMKGEYLAIWVMTYAEKLPANFPSRDIGKKIATFLLE